MRIETACAVAVLVIAACPSLGWAETSCNAEDEEALRVLGKTMQSGHAPSFAARAVVQTAVGSQQIVITRGMPDPDGNYSVQIPDHSSDCDNMSHRLLLEPEHSCGVAQWYKFRVERQMLGDDTATIITALPKDVYRHSFQLVVDEKNDIVLRSTTFSGSNALENVELRALSLASKPELAGDEVQSVAALPDTAQPQANEGGSSWSLGWLPAGFEEASMSHAAVVQARTYTDGLSTFSIFVEQPKGEIRLGEGMVNRGATLAYTRGLQTSQGAALVSVIGEIPINTARMLVEGLEWSDRAE
ncbi:MAG: MucB/RseB C-terminal domain-containing protein [Aequoribacter sp.]|jgi:sigma-E factor negative regulatory protein RseB|uniref:MucB/RseB C-terminal domain-containing protein n=1 Tax=Aequoribacter sp. TaxID=2847771 RepID=UPI003C4E271D